MATKNLVPRLDNEGKLGLKDTIPQRRWAEVNAVSGSFEELKTDKLLNLQGQPLLASGDNITIEYIDGGNLGDQYKITSTASGSQTDPDRIFEGDSSVEVVDTDTEQFIKFTTDNVLRWKIDSSGHLIPEDSSVLDIGSSAKKARNLFLSENLSFSNSTLSENSKFRLSYTNAGVSNTLPVTKHVRAASTVNVDLTNTNHVSLDGVTLTSGDKVLLKNQTTSSENGVYKFSSGQYIRSADFSTNHSFENVIVNVRQGTANSNNLYHSLVQASNGESSIGTNEQLWVQINNEGIEFTNLTEIGADLVDADLFIVDDGPTGVAKSLTALRIKKYIYSAITGDATVNADGDLTIASGSIDPSMLNIDHITFTDGTTPIDKALGDTLNFAGTANEIEVIQNAGTFTFGLPDNVTISGDLTAQDLSVRSIELSGQTSALSMNSQKITNLGAPLNASDAATKSYVDSVAQGLSINNSVRAATNTSGTLASSFAAGESIDGVTLVAGDRILLKDQSNAVENGIYVVTSGTPTRASDMSSGGQAGVFMFVEEGTENADKGFVCISDSGSDAVGTDSLSFTTFSSAGQVTAGSGLSQSGSIFNVNVDTDGGLEIVSDELRVKSGGITDSMLAGSISASKIGQITNADSVAIGALDFGSDQLVSLTDDDKFIVKDDPSNAIRTLLASNISSYVFGNVSGNATIASSGALTIASNAIEASMLSSNIITGQDLHTTSHNDDLILVTDSQNGNALKKITKSSFIQGASVNVDVNSLTEISNSEASEFDELLINDKVSENTLGSNKKIKAKDLVRNSFLYTTQILSSESTTTVKPNSLVLLANNQMKYTVTLEDSSAKPGDIIKIRINSDTRGDWRNIFYVESLTITNFGTGMGVFSADEIKGSGLEFVYNGSDWESNFRKLDYYWPIKDSILNLSLSGRLNQKNFALYATNTKEIQLPSYETLSSWGLTNNTTYAPGTPYTFEFISFADQTVTIRTYNGSTQTKDQIIQEWSPSSPTAPPTTTSEVSFQFKNNTSFKARWLPDKKLWFIERINLDAGSISLESLSNVNWNPLDSASADNTILVSKTSSPGEIYGEKLTHEFIKIKDPSNNNIAGITRTVISDNAIGTSEIEDNNVTKAKLEKVSPYRLLGVVDPNHPESSNVNDKETVNEVKVYTDFDTHATDVTNSNITEHNSLPTTQAVKNYVTSSISSLNITSSSSNARSLTLDDQNKSAQLIASDIFKTTNITINTTEEIAANMLFPSMGYSQVSSAYNTYFTNGFDPNSMFKIYMPPVTSIDGAAVGDILQFNITINKSQQTIKNAVLFLPNPNDPTIGTITSETSTNSNINSGSLPEAVFVGQYGIGPYFDNDYYAQIGQNENIGAMAGFVYNNPQGSYTKTFTLELVHINRQLETNLSNYAGDTGRILTNQLNNVTINNAYQWVIR